jgi:DNA-binding response OmpR family regulator
MTPFPTPSLPPPPRAQAVVIQDDADTLAAIGRVLTEMRIDALPVVSCQAARHAAATVGPPDLVIADARLTDGSGVDCASEMKARYGCRTLVYSGSPRPDAADGIDAWLLKPADLTALRDAVAELVDGYAGRRRPISG